MPSTLAYVLACIISVVIASLCFVLHRTPTSFTKKLLAGPEHDILESENFSTCDDRRKAVAVSANGSLVGHRSSSRYKQYDKSCKRNKVDLQSNVSDIDVVVAKGLDGVRLHRHILTTLCGCKPIYHEQLLRLLKSIILTQASVKYSKGTFNWDVWVLMDETALFMFAPKVLELSKFAMRLQKRSKITFHLLKNNALMSKYGDIVAQIPFEPCHAMFFFAADALPEQVDEIIVFGVDQLVVDDLELHWQNAVDMGWNSSKLFANAEERAKFTVLNRRMCWGWECDDKSKLQLQRDGICNVMEKEDQKKHRRRLEERSGNRRRKKSKDDEGEAEDKPKKMKVPVHQFLHSGIATGSHMVSLRNSRRYGLAQWMADIITRCDPASFLLGDQHVVNRYGMEFPERMTILQCNVDVRSIGSCDVYLHPPIVIHGSGGRFQPVPRDTHFTRHDAPKWYKFAMDFDRIYNLWIKNGEDSLPGTSIWTGVDQIVREKFIQCLGFGRNLVGATSPRIDLPPIDSSTNISDFEGWKRTYLDVHFNADDMRSVIKRTLHCV